MELFVTFVALYFGIGVLASGITVGLCVNAMGKGGHPYEQPPYGLKLVLWAFWPIGCPLLLGAVFHRRLGWLFDPVGFIASVMTKKHRSK